jgi:hypothetical protein
MLAVGITQRIIWGLFAFAIPLLLWILIAGAWPKLWYCAIFILIGILGIWMSPLPIILWRHVRLASHIQSPAYALEHGAWTEVRHVQEGGAVQVLKMGDGNYIYLSIGMEAVIVFVTPKIGDANQLTQLAAFPVKDRLSRTGLTRDERRIADEKMLEHLRKEVGWPKTTAELTRTLERLPPSFFAVCAT